MSAADWNWRLEADLQDYPWDCSAASTAWALNTIGYSTDEQTVIAGLGPQRISATYGLLDASGAGLVEYLAELGVQAANNPAASWQDLQDAAGHQPMVIGGRAWCHWVAVRMGTQTAQIPGFSWLALMNPAPGWMDVGQYLALEQFEYLGPFSAVWFEAW